MRFRLTVSYLVFFTLLFALVGVVFRKTLEGIQEEQVREALEVQWRALRVYLRIKGSEPIWVFDRRNPGAVFLVERLRRVFLLADAQGQILELSPGYRVIGPDSAEEIRQVIQSGEATWRIRSDPRGVKYLIRAGVVTSGQEQQRYYAAVGRALDVNQAVLKQFTWNYFAILPVFIISGGLIGWVFAGPALRPLNDLVEASQRISGSNLSLRIPLRGAGDELDRLIDTFNHTMGRLEESFLHMRQFTTDVSHELRTPITAVRGQLEVALYTAKTIEQYRHAVLEALEEAERLSQFVKAMLNLSLAESGQLTLQKEQVDLSPLTRELVEQFQVAAEEAKVQLVFEAPPQSMAEVDRIQFERLVANLLSNAIKYTPAGGEVHVRLNKNGNSITLAVEDTGCGIPAEHLPRIFDRFYRAPSVDSAMDKGMGLGLSFVAWIVKAHGGRIEVESTVGKGSRFLVTLPASAAQVLTPPPEPVSFQTRTEQ